MDIRAEITSYVIENSGQEFNGNDFKALLGPGVYVFMKEDRPIYVGMGRSLLGRCSGLGHHKAHTARKECDKVLLFPCIHLEAAHKLETILIGRFQPQYNLAKKLHIANALLGNRPNCPIN